MRSQVRDLDHDLVVWIDDRPSDIRVECINLAREIYKRGVDVLLTTSEWPRDNFVFYDDEGRFEIIPRENREDVDHESQHGGKILQGPGFIVASDSVDKSKRKKTKKILDAGIAVYVTLDEIIEEFKDLLIGGNDFYADSQKHIDKYFYLCNRTRTIVTYDHPLLLKMTHDIVQKINYSVVALPFDDTYVAGVGFIELGDHIAIDRRASGSMEILKRLGYDMIPSPKPMKIVNEYGGSIRCVTKEMPKLYHRLEYDFSDFSHNSLVCIDGVKVKIEHSKRNSRIILKNN